MDFFVCREPCRHKWQAKLILNHPHCVESAFYTGWVSIYKKQIK